MIISFIIPVYNTEQYVEKCVLSIINQGVDKGEYEIILVDDGSTDDSPKILSNLEQKYSQIKLISQENRGQGSARNVALREAKADYVFFVDSDDYILPNTMIGFLEFIKENIDTDIICFNTFREIDGELEVSVTRSYFKEYALSGEQYLNQYNLHSGPCNSVFCRSFLINNSLFMPEMGGHEDEIFSLKTYVYAKTIRSYNHFIYVYLKRKGSTTIPQTTEKKMMLIDHLLYTVRILRSFSREEHLSSLQISGIELRLNCLVVEIIIKLSKIPYQKVYCEEIFDELINLNLFPLPQRSDSWRYELFRFFFKTKRRAFFILKLRLIKFYHF